MTAEKRYKRIGWYPWPINIGERWVLDNQIHVVKTCRRILWWYRVVFERGHFKKGEF